MGGFLTRACPEALPSLPRPTRPPVSNADELHLDMIGEASEDRPHELSGAKSPLSRYLAASSCCLGGGVVLVGLIGLVSGFPR